MQNHDQVTAGFNRRFRALNLQTRTAAHKFHRETSHDNTQNSQRRLRGVQMVFFALYPYPFSYDQLRRNRSLLALRTRRTNLRSNPHLKTPYSDKFYKFKVTKGTVYSIFPPRLRYLNTRTTNTVPPNLVFQRLLRCDYPYTHPMTFFDLVLKPAPPRSNLTNSVFGLKMPRTRPQKRLTYVRLVR